MNDNITLDEALESIPDDVRRADVVFDWLTNGREVPDEHAKKAVEVYEKNSRWFEGARIADLTGDHRKADALYAKATAQNIDKGAIRGGLGIGMVAFAGVVIYALLSYYAPARDKVNPAPVETVSVCRCTGELTSRFHEQIVKASVLLDSPDAQKERQGLDLLVKAKADYTSALNACKGEQ